MPYLALAVITLFYRNQGGGGGAIFDTNLTPQFNVTVGYLAGGSTSTGNPAPIGNPSGSNGLFNGSYTALGQLAYKPSDNFKVALTYARSYFPANLDSATGVTTAQTFTGSTGSNNASSPFGGRAASQDQYAAEIYWRAAPKFVIAGWAGFAIARTENSSTGGGDSRSVQLGSAGGLPGCSQEG